MAGFFVSVCASDPLTDSWRLLGVFELLAGFLGLLLHFFLQQALALFELRLFDRLAVEHAGEAFERNLDRVRRALEVDRGQNQFAALLEAGDDLVGQQHFGDALVGHADRVIELLGLAAVDLQLNADGDETRARNRNLHDLAVGLAGHGDEANGRDQLAAACRQQVLHDADVIVFLLGADLEPALRRTGLLCQRYGRSSRHGNGGSEGGKHGPLDESRCEDHTSSVS
jgi:hypothetical protein